jgi:lipopolysaccharide assembly outer membrane protein LptD (OstA)
MNWWKHRISRWLISVGMIVFALSGASHAQDALLSGVGVRVPLEVYDNGQVKVSVTAGTASPQENGHIFATDVRIEMFTEEGVVEGVITAESCDVDRENEVVTSTTDVNYQRDGLTISGTGFEWRGTNQSFRILKNARVVFQREALKGFGDLPVAAN